MWRSIGLLAGRVGTSRAAAVLTADRTGGFARENRIAVLLGLGVLGGLGVANPHGGAGRGDDYGLDWYL